MSLASALEKVDDWRRREIPRLASPAIATLFAVFVLVAMYRRLLLSVDFTDESFSTALAYRFALGDRPFIDEVSPNQTAGILAWPFVWLYIKAVGSSAGIMLFTRIVFLVFNIGVGGAVFATIRRYLAWPLALVTALAAVVYIPHSVPNLGYNVLGAGFQAISGFLLVRSYGGAEQKRALFWAGVTNGLAIVAYPPLVVGAVIAGGVLFFTRATSIRQLGEFVVGGVLVGLCIAPLLVAAGGDNLGQMLALGGRLTPRPISKLWEIALAFWKNAPVSMWFLPGIAALVSALRLRPAWSVWALPFLVLGLTLAFPINIATGLSITAYAAFLAPVFLVLLWDLPFCRALFFGVWIPSMVAGFVTAFSSSNAEQNGGIGMRAAAIVFIVYEAIAVARLWREANPEAEHESPVLLLGPIVLAVGLLANFSFSVYRDEAPGALGYRVPSGPYRGLYTTPARGRQIAEIENIFKQYGNPEGHVVALWEMSGAYLFSSMRPGINTVWPAGTSDQEIMLRYYRRHLNGKGFALHFGKPTKTLPIEIFLDEHGRMLDANPNLQVIGEPAP